MSLRPETKPNLIPNVGLWDVGFGLLGLSFDEPHRDPVHLRTPQGLFSAAAFRP